MVNERNLYADYSCFACVRIIAETIASLPLHTYRYRGEGKEKMYDHPLYRICMMSLTGDELFYLAGNDDDPSSPLGEQLLSDYPKWSGRCPGLYPLLRIRCW
jgi:hypothetical protein